MFKIIMDVGLLLYILLGFRYSPNPQREMKCNVVLEGTDLSGCWLCGDGEEG